MLSGGFRKNVCFFILFVSGALAFFPLTAQSEDFPPLDPKTFIEEAEVELELIQRFATRAGFLKGTDETPEHVRLSVEAAQIYERKSTSLAKISKRIDRSSLSPRMRRKYSSLTINTVLPSPNDHQKANTLASLISKLKTNYTSAQNCTDPNRKPCRKKSVLYDVLSTSRDSAELLSAWREWHSPAEPIRQSYADMVTILNQGAEELGYNDLGELWRSHYEMAPHEFAAEYDRLWNQVKPLFNALHCHVRAKLRDQYGQQVPEAGLIPAHLLGNMWAQHWTGIDELVGIGTDRQRLDITDLLKAKGYTPRDMIRAGEDFFVSLDFPKLPAAFWQRSMFTEPKNKKANCQASAWDINARKNDVRLKMCTKVTEQDFLTVHHELGHIYYYLAYKDQPYLFRSGANPGFHEAIGDVLARSITPSYLASIGLLDTQPPVGSDLPFLFRTALDMIPRLAMSIVVDKWRWGVFSGEISAKKYNSGWWALRKKYQGLAPPEPRTEKNFDAGMFYHISNNVPYDRYFVAQILQFDIHRGLCLAAKNTGPLHLCSIYRSKAAGAKLKEALSDGSSRPWPEVLHGLTGKRTIDAAAIIDYFSPVMNWLKEQNQSRQCGW